MSQEKHRTSTKAMERRWEPLTDDVMDLIYERILKLKTMGRMGEIYLEYQCECVEKYEVDYDLISLWLDIFEETVTELDLLIV